ncbi:hypothetical protein K8I61_01865, partial [bacterium]|nr:hypothetical protein [bacterium]
MGVIGANGACVGAGVASSIEATLVCASSTGAGGAGGGVGTGVAIATGVTASSGAVTDMASRVVFAFLGIAAVIVGFFIYRS